MLGVGGARRRVLLGDDPLGQVVDLVEAGPPSDRQLARAPEIFERGLLRLPPPPPLLAGPLSLEIAGHQRPLLDDALAHVADHRLRLGPDALHPPRMLQHPAAVALEADLPVGIPRGGDGRGVVRPVLEEPALALQEPLQQARLIPLEPGGEDQMMRPLDHVDRVDLDEAHPLDQLVEGVRGRLAARVVEQPLGAQEEAAGGGGGEGGKGGRRLEWHGERIAEGAR